MAGMSSSTRRSPTDWSSKQPKLMSTCVTEHSFSHDPSSSSNSPKLSAVRAPMHPDSEDEGEVMRELHGMSDSDREGRSGGDSSSPDANGSNGGRLDGPQEGRLPRDRPMKTAFFDPIAERQMSQTDAKLFYQRSQLDLQKTAGGLWTGQAEVTPHGSPVLSSKGSIHGPSAAFEIGAEARSPPRTRISDPRAHHLREARVGSNADPTRVQAGVAQVENLAGVGAASLTEPAPQSQPQNLGGLEGIGSSTYIDADPQITAELGTIYDKVQKILTLRRRYIKLSLQGSGDNPKDDPSWNIYPPPPEPAWVEEHSRVVNGTRATSSLTNSLANSLVLSPDQISHTVPDPLGENTPERERSKGSKKRKPGQNIGEDFDINDVLPVPGPSPMTYRLDGSGVYQVFESDEAAQAESPLLVVPTLREYYMDLEFILATSADGPNKSFAYRRLQYLEGKFSLYTLVNDYQETAESKKVPHRDFYNVRKVDTHVHHSACMNQKHLLRFIKSKMKKCPDEVVLFRDGKHLTLAEVFQSINLTAYDLSIDTLDMHVCRPQRASPRRALTLTSNRLTRTPFTDSTSST